MSFHGLNKNVAHPRHGSSIPGQSGSSRTTLAAVAFQDQLMRNLSLADPIRRKPVPGVKSGTSWKKNVKPTIDTGLVRKTPKKKQNVAEQEYVLDPKPPPPTLAQRLGLVEAPTSHLSEEAWRAVKCQSNEREDSKQPCVICKEEFGTDQQVLLSCTHVFHRSCLEAFERFTGKKTCPLCRKEQYQKRVIHDGARHHRHTCATRIQAAWRGHVVRRWYQKLRQTAPPKDPRLRQKFYEDKFKVITDRMVNSYDTDVTSFLRDLDQSLEVSRAVFQHFDDVTRQITADEWTDIELKAADRGTLDCPICLNPLDGYHGIDVSDVRKVEDGAQGDVNLTADVQRKPGQGHRGQKSAASSKSASMTSQTVTSGSQRMKVTPRSEGRKMVARRRRILLSCSHVFHQTCLEALEEFAVGERRFVCPVCRSCYQKRTI